MGNKTGLSPVVKPALFLMWSFMKEYDIKLKLNANIYNLYDLIEVGLNKN